MDSLKKILMWVIVSIDGLGFVLGFYLVLHGMFHPTDHTGHAEVSIPFIGSLSGSEPMVMIFSGFGFMVIFGAHLFKLYKGLTWKAVAIEGTGQVKRWSSRITEAGKQIARLKRQNRKGE